MTRRPDIDWLRGVGVLVMIAAHAFDAWTLDAERTRLAYTWTIAVGGVGAPLFLFLAGVTMALTGASRERRGVAPAEVAARVRRRGWQIFGLAFLFRLQAIVVSGGHFPWGLFKVDILNLMGLAMVLAAAVWGAVRTRPRRILACAAIGVAAILAGPVTRGSAAFEPIPMPLVWYLQPVPGQSSFTLFPWIAFLLIGVAVGLVYDRAIELGRERRAMVVLTVLGLTATACGWVALDGPAIFGPASPSGSPASMAVRLGVVWAGMGVAFAWCTLRPGRSWLTDLGASSFFVYWIHVELVYGVFSRAIHRDLTYEQALVAYVAFSAVMVMSVLLKNRLTRPHTRPDLAQV